MDPNSTIVKLGQKLMIGIQKLTDKDEAKRVESSPAEDIETSQFQAFETGSMRISGKTSFAGANELKLHRKTVPTSRKRSGKALGRKSGSAFDSTAPIVTSSSLISKEQEISSPRLDRASTEERPSVAVYGHSVTEKIPVYARTIDLTTGKFPELEEPKVLKDVSDVLEGEVLQGATAPMLTAIKEEQPTVRKSIDSPKRAPSKRITLADERKSRRKLVEEVRAKRRITEYPVKDQLVVRSPVTERPITPPATPQYFGRMEFKQPIVTALEMLTAKQGTQEISLPHDVSQLKPEDLNYRIVMSPYGPMLQPVSKPTPQQEAKLIVLSKQASLVASEEKLSALVEEIQEVQLTEAAKASESSTVIVPEYEELPMATEGRSKPPVKSAGTWTWIDQLLSAREYSVVRSKALLDDRFGKGLTRPGRKRPPKIVLDLLEGKVSRLTHLVKDIDEAESVRSETPVPEKRVDTLLQDKTATTETLLARKDKSTEKSRRIKISAEHQPVRPARTAGIFERFTADMDTATHYMQKVLPPGRLSRLLDSIRSGRGPAEEVADLEHALIQAVHKAQEERESCTVTLVRHSNRPSTIAPSQWNKLGAPEKKAKLQPIRLVRAVKGVHCRYAMLALRGYHKQDLSISAHLTRLDLMEFINKSIQQRAYRRIQKSMAECMKKVI